MSLFGGELRPPSLYLTVASAGSPLTLFAMEAFANRIGLSRSPEAMVIIINFALAGWPGIDRGPAARGFVSSGRSFSCITSDIWPLIDPQELLLSVTSRDIPAFNCTARTLLASQPSWAALWEAAFRLAADHENRPANGLYPSEILRAIGDLLPLPEFASANPPFILTRGQVELIESWEPNWFAPPFRAPLKVGVHPLSSSFLETCDIGALYKDPIFVNFLTNSTSPVRENIFLALAGRTALPVMTEELLSLAIVSDCVAEWAAASLSRVAANPGSLERALKRLVGPEANLNWQSTSGKILSRCTALPPFDDPFDNARVWREVMNAYPDPSVEWAVYETGNTRLLTNLASSLFAGADPGATKASFFRVLLLSPEFHDTDLAIWVASKCIRQGNPDVTQGLFSSALESSSSTLDETFASVAEILSKRPVSPRPGFQF